VVGSVQQRGPAGIHERGDIDGRKGAKHGHHEAAGDDRQVELSITYLSDAGGGGRGAFVDDTRLIVGGTTVDTSDFEIGLGPWTAAAAPAGSPGNVVA
jgi:bacillopeptidase F (M6 metalloprotease family)